MNFLIHQSWITSLKAKKRDYPSGLEPDLISRKAFIYLSYYTLTYPPLTSILPSPHGSRGQNECHISVSVLGNISTAFLALSVDGNISTNRTVYEKGTLARRALNNKH